MDETPLPAVDRRAALEQLRALTAAGDLAVTPITTADAEGLELVIVRLGPSVDDEGAWHVQRTWSEGVKGTALEGVKVLITTRDCHVLLVRHGRLSADDVRALEAEQPRREWACGCQTFGPELARDCGRGLGAGCDVRRAHADGRFVVSGWPTSGYPSDQRR